MDWTLERVNGPRNFIVLDRSARSIFNLQYPCGRNANNKIVCPSLVVSRRHCIFVRTDDVISVIDLESSNGVYRNGQLLEPNVLVELQENDSIGIGSSDEYRDNEPMFVYKLHKGNLNSRNLEEFDDLLTQKSLAVDDTNKKSNALSISAPISDGNVSTLKRNLPNDIKENKETPVVPIKISKLSNGFDKISEDNSICAADSPPIFTPKGSSTDDEPLEIEEIEEIWSTLSPTKISNGKRNEMDNKKEAAKILDKKKVGQIEIDLNGSNRLSLNYDNEKFKKPWKKVEILDGEKELRNPGSSSSSSSFSVNLNPGKKNTAQINKQGRKTEKDAAGEVNERITSPTVQKSNKFDNGVENSDKPIRFSIDSLPLATRIAADILPANKLNQGAEENEEILQRSFEGEEKNANHKKKKDKHVKKSSKRVEVPTTSSPEVSTFEEDKIASRLSFCNKEPVASSSPFKLKLVKQEPMTSFSIFDTVDLSDDDEDVFPSSQLFDSTSEGIGAFKVEDGLLSPKTENLFENDEDEESKVFFTQVDPAIEESEEIITLSDSDDEENTWLDRLSESQRIKEEEPEIEDKNEAQEIDGEMFEMEFVDHLKQDLSFEEEEVKPDIQVPRVEAKSDSPKLDLKKIIKPRKSMTESEIEKNINEETSDDFSPHSSPPPRERVKKSREKSTEEPTRVKQTPIEKGPKIIEPLRLPARKRVSLRDSVSSSIDADTLASPSTSKGRVRVRDCSVEVPKLPSNLTVKQKRQLEIEDKIKQKKYEEEQRIRRIKNKWAQSVPLPLGKRKSPSISKKQKLKIVNERKEKLKALATKQKAEAVKPSVERVAVKAKAKVSTKNRGDFLINEQVVKQVEDAGGELGEASSSKKELKSSKSSSKSSEKRIKSIDSKKVAEVPKRVAASDEKEETKVKTDKKRTEKRSKSVEKTQKDSSAVATTSNTVEKGIAEPSLRPSLTQKENRVPNSLDMKKKGEEKGDEKKDKKIRKTVSFSENLSTVRVFEIDENNTMKKCTGKDALIPKDKIAGAKRKGNKSQHPKLEEFLMLIFRWNPSWLEEQKNLKTEPPIVNNESLVPLLTNYKSYKDYYQILMPVLLLELWHGITKEFESIDKNNRRQTVYCSIVNNSVTYQPIPSTNATLTTMLLEVLASEDDIRRQIHPVYGDLVFLELCYRNEEGKQNFLKVFAYVTQLHRTVITQNTFFNRDLTNYTRNPSRVLTYSVLTRHLKVQLCINRVLRLRCVTYLRSNMRMVQALQSLPSSPLVDLIINPRVEEYKLASPTKQCFLVTRDKLNHKQTEAVFKTTEAIVRKEPKICLVQGPPGTGKSEVIVNMVMQILYADNRYKNREESGLRILLCAPSNAAIDEIVLRLLDRRAKLTNDRFRMVRVGLLAPMHPRVREISVEELAKRDVKRTMNSYQTCGQSMDNVEEEKRFLEARINALQSKLASTQQKDESQIQYTNMKLLDAKTRYELMNTWTQSNGNNINPRDLVKIQRGAETKILIGADIIACTLSSCYTNLMESSFGSGSQRSISVCIVDEATQSCEAETLIPLMLGINTLVLVGDPAQLPATVISQRAKKLGLDQSLFSRAQRALEGVKNSPVIMLDVQYRMDSRISCWPNKYFYGGKLRNGVSRDQPLLPFHPYRVVNLDSSQNNDKFSNSQEAEFVANLIYTMINYMDCKKIPHTISIGVITPYRNQQTLVEAKINQRLSPILENLKIKVTTEVNTIDSFQGHERDIIIMSCVRTNGIGFLSDRQRLCVALTRAKHCLILCGNFATFQRDTMWRALLADAQSRNSYIDVKSNLNPNDILSKLVR